MSTSSVDPPELDLRIKGSLPSGSAPPSIRHHHHHPPPLQPTNPLETAPSSPSQIYLNLLILEASLRSQYLRHLARRRKFTGFLIALFIWTSIFGYRFFILGGSPYYYVSLLEMLALGGGVFTGVLFYATGLYDKTIVEPRRFVFMANRGLRTYNVKLVKVPLSYREWISWWWGWYTFRPPPQQPSNTTARRRLSSNNRRPTPPVPSHSHSPSISSATRRPSLAPPHQDDEDDEEEVEEYLPGGIHLKLVILPKGFSPDFREGWELYRTEYSYRASCSLFSYRIGIFPTCADPNTGSRPDGHSHNSHKERVYGICKTAVDHWITFEGWHTWWRYLGFVHHLRPGRKREGTAE